MRLRSANERLLTDVCVPLPASRIVVQFLCRPAKSAGLAAYPEPLSAIMRVVAMLALIVVFPQRAGAHATAREREA